MWQFASLKYKVFEFVPHTFFSKPPPIFIDLKSKVFFYFCRIQRYCLNSKRSILHHSNLMFENFYAISSTQNHSQIFVNYIYTIYDYVEGKENFTLEVTKSRVWLRKEMVWLHCDFSKLFCSVAFNNGGVQILKLFITVIHIATFFLKWHGTKLFFVVQNDDTVLQAWQRSRCNNN